MSAYHPPLATPRLPPAAPLTPQDPTMTDFVPRWTTGDDISHRLLEALANELAQAAESRRTLVGQLRQELMTAAAPLLPALRTATAAERDAKSTLLQAVTDAPGLFAKPRTRNAHGVKYGWALGKPSIDIPDEARTLRLIRAKVPEEQATLLVRVTEKVDRRAVLDLSAKDLRALGIRQLPGLDVPLVSLPKDDVDRLIDTLLAETVEAQP
jgi:hypothetical protein